MHLVIVTIAIKNCIIQQTKSVIALFDVFDLCQNTEIKSQDKVIYIHKSTCHQVLSKLNSKVDLKGPY